MRDKRPVDELSIDELERILAIRKREERQKQLQRMQRSGRVVAQQPIVGKPPTAEIPPPAKVAAVEKPSTPVDPAHAPRFEDEVDEVEIVAAEKRGDDGRLWRAFVNRSLLVIEVLAVVGLVLLGANLFDAISTLERETAQAAQLADEQRRASIATPVPTPILRLVQVVLPGGHTFTEAGTPQFNTAEIPAHMLASVQAEIMQPVAFRPPATSETALVLSIPRLNLDQTIVQGVDWEALRLGIGQVMNGINPSDESGNVVLAAHNDIYGEYFRDLDQLEVGDLFTIQTETQVYTYEITLIDIYEPTDVWVMDNREGATATLISCYPYRQNTHRIVVFADRLDS
jgi:sortase A